MIIRARAVVTMAGASIANGAVALEGNRIVDVGSWPEVRARNAGEAIDLGERALLPGLINAHCHLDYTLLRGAIPSQSSFTGWIQAINARKTELAPADYLRSIEAGLAEAAGFGTTTIANLEAFPELVGEVVNEPRLRTWWFAEMIDLRGPVVAADVLDRLEKNVRLPNGLGLAPHAPFTASRNLYAETAALAAERSIPVTTHLAESAEEMAMFRDGSGALFDLVQQIGRPMEDCGGVTPLGLMLQNKLLDERWLIAHLNELTPADFELLADGPRFHVVHCPRSHAWFGHTPFALKKLRALGFNICLGTDSLASNHDLSLFSEMRHLWKTEPSLRAEEILAMVTVNAAAALGQPNTLGRLRAGCVADLIAVPFTGARAEVAEEVISFSGRASWLMVDGELSQCRRE
ncbi:MAG: amidohydrolase family protein [Chthoniobacterales bacterium]